jgi:hypothetical protein
MSMSKEKIGVVAGSVPVIAALALVLLPFISYLAWAIDQLLLSPGIPRDPSGPSTVLDFIGVNAGYMILGIVLAFVAFPAFAECVKNMKLEAQDHALLVDELRSHDVIVQASGDAYDQLSNKELVYRINNIHAGKQVAGICGNLLCFKCGSAISARQNQQFHGSCADCHYMGNGLAAYLKGLALIAIAVLLAALALVTATYWIWWAILCLGLLAFAFIAWGHYLRESKARV